jgi:hypothetical protein
MLVVFLMRLLAGNLEQAGVSTLQPLLLLQLLFLVAFFCICVMAGPWHDTDAILVGFTIQCVLGAAFEAAAVLWSLALCRRGLPRLPSQSVWQAGIAPLKNSGQRTAGAVHDDLPSLTSRYSQSLLFGTNGFVRDPRSVPSDWRIIMRSYCILPLRRLVFS